MSSTHLSISAFLELPNANITIPSNNMLRFHLPFKSASLASPTSSTVSIFKMLSVSRSRVCNFNSYRANA
ncbi:hypothetical protein AB3S75_010503 [Citrus x aurantiifolia]